MVLLAIGDCNGTSKFNKLVGIIALVIPTSSEMKMKTTVAHISSEDQAQLLSMVSITSSPGRHLFSMGTRDAWPHCGKQEEPSSIFPVNLDWRPNLCFISGKSCSLEGNRLSCHWLQSIFFGVLGEMLKRAPWDMLSEAVTAKRGHPGNPLPPHCRTLLFNPTGTCGMDVLPTTNSFLLRG